MKNWEDFKNLLNKTTEEPFSKPNKRKTDDGTRNVKKSEKKVKWGGKINS